MNVACTDRDAAPATLRVALKERSYDIVVGDGLLHGIGERVAAVAAGAKAVTITDANVAPHYLDIVDRSLRRAGLATSAVVLPAGEATKDFRHLEHLTEKVLACGIDRATSIVALGGGVIGDIAGFAAGILLRGLSYVQVPTTLLAQVDSAVGGKTGINSPFGKNLVGLFHQPRLVVADIATLDTLDARQLRAGYAEVVKYGLISDRDFFAWLEADGASVVAGNRAARARAILTSCAAKAAIVAADEREAGRRALLNLGHTFGHALEAETGFGDALLHGEAVAIGVVMAFALSARLGLCSPQAAERVRRHLAGIGLPTRPTDVAGQSWPMEALLGHMAHDKKVTDGRIRFVLARDIGDAFVADGVDADHLRAVIEESTVRRPDASPAPHVIPGPRQ
ncbi:MAG: 3-dehydroquinate synthase [Rhodospirillales bacterium]|nr:3-dehydroquinate synthase [Rhodospirillales bacterium]